MKILLGIKLILFIIFYIFVFVCTNETINNGYIYSSMFIAFSCFIALVTCFKYDIIKLIFEKAKKYKLIYSSIVIFMFFLVINLIYSIVPQFCNIHDWADLIYNEVDNTQDNFLALVFLPVWYDDIDISKMTLIEAVFSIIFVIIAHLRENFEKIANQYEEVTKYGIIGYICDKILKFIFKYKLFIIFFIYVLTIPSKFLKIYNIKNIGISVLSLAGIIFSIKNFISIKKCIDKNKQKYGKENLIIVAYTDSTKFLFNIEFINLLHKFSKFDEKNIGKGLLIDAKKYNFIHYDVVRYNLLNIKRYKNVAYSIFLKLSFEAFLYANYSFEDEGKSINEIVNGNKKYIVFPKHSWYYEQVNVDVLNKKYIFRYRNKFDIKSIIDALNLNEDDINIKYQISDELNKINEVEEKSKNMYITYSLNKILNSFNYIEYFYCLLKICEYIMHYMALKNIINNSQEIIDKKINIKTGTLAVWRDSIKYDKVYTKGLKADFEIIDSVIKLRTILKFKTNYDDNYRFEFKKDLCKIIIDIRNNLLGHGVITYDVSERIVKYLLIITKEFITIFESLDVTIEEDEKIKNIFANDIYAIYKEGECTYLYNQTNLKDEEAKEYLNYETGKRKVTKNIPEYMDKIWTPNEIEKNLKKYM